MILSAVGRVFFGVALVAFGVEQFLFGDFIPGRARAWPSGVPGQLAWGWISGALLIVTGAAIVWGKRARLPTVLSAATVFVWAFLRHLPAVFATPRGAVLTATGKALALVGGALAIAGSLPVENARWRVPAFVRDERARFVTAGAACLGAFMVLGGIQHFQYPAIVRSLVPEWMPYRMFWVYFAAIALIAGGIGMQVRRTAWIAATASAVMLSQWVVVVHLPRAFAASAAAQRDEWTAVFEALAFAGIAFVVAGERRKG